MKRNMKHSKSKPNVVFGKATKTKKQQKTKKPKKIKKPKNQKNFFSFTNYLLITEKIDSHLSPHSISTALEQCKT